MATNAGLKYFFFLDLWFYFRENLFFLLKKHLKNNKKPIKIFLRSTIFFLFFSVQLTKTLNAESGVVLLINKNSDELYTEVRTRSYLTFYYYHPFFINFRYQVNCTFSIMFVLIYFRNSSTQTFFVTFINSTDDVFYLKKLLLIFQLVFIFNLYEIIYFYNREPFNILSQFFQDYHSWILSLFRHSETSCQQKSIVWR